MMIEMAFYLSAFGLFTAGRVVRMWMKKTANKAIRKISIVSFFSMKVVSQQVPEKSIREKEMSLINEGITLDHGGLIYYLMAKLEVMI